MRTVELSRADLPQVFALTREDYPELDLEQWLSYGATYVAPARNNGLRGAIAAGTDFYRYRGLFFYPVEPTLPCDRTLILPHVIVPDAPDRSMVLGALMRAAYDVAERTNCLFLQACIRPFAAADLMPLFHAQAQVRSVCLSVDMSSRRNSNGRP